VWLASVQKAAQANHFLLGGTKTKTRSEEDKAFFNFLIRTYNIKYLV